MSKSANDQHESDMLKDATPKFREGSTVITLRSISSVHESVRIPKGAYVQIRRVFRGEKFVDFHYEIQYKVGAMTYRSVAFEYELSEANESSLCYKFEHGDNIVIDPINKDFIQLIKAFEKEGKCITSIKWSHNPNHDPFLHWYAYLDIAYVNTTPGASIKTGSISWGTNRKDCYPATYYYRSKFKSDQFFNTNQSNNKSHDKAKTESLLSGSHCSKVSERTVERGAGLKSNRVKSKLGGNNCHH